MRINLIKYGSVRIAISLISIVFLPSLLFFFNVASSLALGSVFAALIVITIGPKSKNVCNYQFLISLVVVSGIVCHLLLAGMIFPIDWQRALTSLIPVFLFVFSGIALGEMMLMVKESSLSDAISICLLLLIILIILPNIGLPIAEIYSNEYGYLKPIFPFKEPSHFALIFIPFILYFTLKANLSNKYLILIFFFYIGFKIENLTLIVGCILVAFSTLPWRALFFGLIIFFIALSQIELSYFQDRLTINKDYSNNLSLLVYMQGWELIYDSLGRSFGWGIGFQQLGLQDKLTDTGSIIYSLTGSTINVLDGGFTLSKILSEFGYLGMILMFFYVIFFKKSYTIIKHSKLSSPYIFSSSIILSYSIEVFVRGVGYFNGTLILLISSFWVLVHLTSPVSKTTNRSTINLNLI